ncbi:actin cross-linking domain-containing toxin [Streptomyces sp. JV178]|uniref:actin cross-linking domain-containing toxin n=1 Tax=Streptomyces sp. JV178 TaxID=858632 RepID=UPI0011815978|nr:actin cross-linking domain-containing toxin [Streptomyces sp. JV178]
MASPEDWKKVGFDGNPVSGNPDVLDGIARELRGLQTLAGDVDQGLDRMLASSENGGFEGETADALRDYVENELRTFTANVHDSFDRAASAVERYARALRGSRGRADDAARRAGEVAIPPAGLVGKDAPPPAELTAAQQEVEAEADFIDGEAKLLEQALEDASSLVTRPVAKIKKSVWKKFWHALEIIGMVLAIVGAIIGGGVGLLAFAVGAVLFVKAVADFATGKINGLGLALAFLGILFPSTKGITSFTRLLQFIKAGGKALAGGASKAFSASGRMLLQGGRLLLSPRTFASVVGQNLLRVGRSAGGFVVNTLPGALSTAWRVGRDVAVGSWRQFAGGLARDFARTTRFVGGGRALRLGVFALVALPRFAANALLPLKYFEISKFGWRGAFRLGILERGLHLSPSGGRLAARAGHIGGTVGAPRARDPFGSGPGHPFDGVDTPPLVVPGTQAWNDAIDDLGEMVTAPPLTLTPSGISSLSPTPGGLRGRAPGMSSGRVRGVPDDLLGRITLDDLDRWGGPMTAQRGSILLRDPDSAVVRLQELDLLMDLERTGTGLLKPFDHDLAELASLSLDGNLGGLTRDQLFKLLDGEIEPVSFTPDAVVLRIGKTDPVTVRVGFKDELTIRVLDPQESAALPPAPGPLSGPGSSARPGFELADLARLIPDTTDGMRRQARELLGLGPGRTPLDVPPVVGRQDLGVGPVGTQTDLGVGQVGARAGFPPLTLREIITGGAVGRTGAERFQAWVRLQNAEVRLDTAGQELSRLTELPDAPPLSVARAELDLSAAELNLNQVRMDFGRLGMNPDVVRQDITVMMARVDSPAAALPTGELRMLDPAGRPTGQWITLESGPTADWVLKADSGVVPGTTVRMLDDGFLVTTPDGVFRVGPDGMPSTDVQRLLGDLSRFDGLALSGAPELTGLRLRLTELPAGDLAPAGLRIDVTDVTGIADTAGGAPVRLPDLTVTPLDGGAFTVTAPHSGVRWQFDGTGALDFREVSLPGTDFSLRFGTEVSPHVGEAALGRMPQGIPEVVGPHGIPQVIGADGLPVTGGHGLEFVTTADGTLTVRSPLADAPGAPPAELRFAATGELIGRDVPLTGHGLDVLSGTSLRLGFDTGGTGTVVSRELVGGAFGGRALFRVEPTPSTLTGRLGEGVTLTEVAGGRVLHFDGGGVLREARLPVTGPGADAALRGLTVRVVHTPATEAGAGAGARAGAGAGPGAGVGTGTGASTSAGAGADGWTYELIGSSRATGTFSVAPLTGPAAERLPGGFSLTDSVTGLRWEADATGRIDLAASPAEGTVLSGLSEPLGDLDTLGAVTDLERVFQGTLHEGTALGPEPAATALTPTATAATTSALTGGRADLTSVRGLDDFFQAVDAWAQSPRTGPGVFQAERLVADAQAVLHTNGFDVRLLHDDVRGLRSGALARITGDASQALDAHLASAAGEAVPTAPTGAVGPGGRPFEVDFTVTPTWGGGHTVVHDLTGLRMEFDAERRLVSREFFLYDTPAELTGVRVVASDSLDAEGLLVREFTVVEPAGSPGRFVAEPAEPALERAGARFSVVDRVTGNRLHFAPEGTLIAGDIPLGSGLGVLHLDLTAAARGPQVLDRAGTPLSTLRAQSLGGGRVALTPVGDTLTRPLQRVVIDSRSLEVTEKTIGVPGPRGELTGAYWKVDYTTGTAVRLDTEGRPLTGPLDTAVLRTTPSGEFALVGPDGRVLYESAGPGRTVAAVDPGVDPADISPDTPVWRTTDEPLWRYDDRGPETIFTEGFRPKDPSFLDLGAYVRENTPSGFVSTTVDSSLAWGSHYKYEIHAPGGIDVNRTFDKDYALAVDGNPFANEAEISFPGGVRPRFVKGAFDMYGPQHSAWKPNPVFRPEGAEQEWTRQATYFIRAMNQTPAPMATTHVMAPGTAVHSVVQVTEQPLHGAPETVAGIKLRLTQAPAVDGVAHAPHVELLGPDGTAPQGWSLVSHDAGFTVTDPTGQLHWTFDAQLNPAADALTAGQQLLPQVDSPVWQLLDDFLAADPALGGHGALDDALNQLPDDADLFSFDFPVEGAPAPGAADDWAQLLNDVDPPAVDLPAQRVTSPEDADEWTQWLDGVDLSVGPVSAPVPAQTQASGWVIVRNHGGGFTVFEPAGQRFWSLDGQLRAVTENVQVPGTGHTVLFDLTGQYPPTVLGPDALAAPGWSLLGHDGGFAVLDDLGQVRWNIEPHLVEAPDTDALLARGATVSDEVPLPGVPGDPLLQGHQVLVSYPPGTVSGPAAGFELIGPAADRFLVGHADAALEPLGVRLSVLSRDSNNLFHFDSAGSPVGVDVWLGRDMGILRLPLDGSGRAPEVLTAMGAPAVGMGALVLDGGRLAVAPLGSHLTRPLQHVVIDSGNLEVLEKTVGIPARFGDRPARYWRVDLTTRTATTLDESGLPLPSGFDPVRVDLEPNGEFHLVGSDNSVLYASSGPGRTLAAGDLAVDLGTLAPERIVWRKTDEVLWRNDNRGPDVIFNEGFRPRDPAFLDLDEYVTLNTPSAFVSTTVDSHLGWGSKFRYEIHAPGGIDANETFRANHAANPFENEAEISFPGGVHPRFVRRVEELHQGQPVGQLDNLGFSPFTGDEVSRRTATYFVRSMNQAPQPMSVTRTVPPEEATGVVRPVVRITEEPLVGATDLAGARLRLTEVPGTGTSTAFSRLELVGRDGLPLPGRQVIPREGGGFTVTGGALGETHFGPGTRTGSMTAGASTPPGPVRVSEELEGFATRAFGKLTEREAGRLWDQANTIVSRFDASPPVGDLDPTALLARDPERYWRTMRVAQELHQLHGTPDRFVRAIDVARSLTEGERGADVLPGGLVTTDPPPPAAVPAEAAPPTPAVADVPSVADMTSHAVPETPAAVPPHPVPPPPAAPVPPPAPVAPAVPAGVRVPGAPVSGASQRVVAPGFPSSFGSTSLGTESELSGFVVAVPQNADRTFAFVQRVDTGEPLVMVTKDMGQGAYGNPAKLAAAERGNWQTHTVELVTYPSRFGDEAALADRDGATRFLLDVFRDRLGTHNHAPLASLVSPDGQFRLQVTNDRHVIAAGRGMDLEEQPSVSMPSGQQQATVGVRASELGAPGSADSALLLDHAPWFRADFRQDEALRAVAATADAPERVENAYTYLKSVVSFLSDLVKKHDIPLGEYPGAGRALTHPQVKNDWKVLPRTRPNLILGTLSDHDRALTQRLLRETAPLGDETIWKEVRQYVMGGGAVAGHGIDKATIAGEQALLFEFRELPDRLLPYVPREAAPTVAVSDPLAGLGGRRIAVIREVNEFVGRPAHQEAFADWYRAQLPHYQGHSSDRILGMASAGHKATWVRAHHPQTWLEITARPAPADLRAPAGTGAVPPPPPPSGASRVPPPPAPSDASHAPSPPTAPRPPTAPLGANSGGELPLVARAERAVGPVNGAEPLGPVVRAGEVPGSTVRDVPLSGVPGLRGLGVRITEVPATPTAPASVRMEVLDRTASGGPARLPDTVVTAREGGGFTLTGRQGGPRWQFDADGRLDFRELPLPGTEVSVRFDSGGTHAVPRIVDGDGRPVRGATISPPLRDASGTVTGMTTVRVPVAGTGDAAGRQAVFRFDGTGLLRQQELPLTSNGLGPSGLGVRVTITPGAHGATTRLIELTGPRGLVDALRLDPVDDALAARLPDGLTVTHTATGSRFHFAADGHLMFQDTGPATTVHAVPGDTAPHLPNDFDGAPGLPHSGPLTDGTPASGFHLLTDGTTAPPNAGLLTAATPPDIRLPGDRGLLRFDATAPDAAPRVLDAAGDPAAVRAELLDDGRIALIPTGPAAHPAERAVFDAGGETLLEETVAIRGRGGKPTGELWRIDHATGKAVRTDADGTAFTGAFDTATVERSATGQFRLLADNPGRTPLFEREVLRDGNVLHLDVSRSGRARWTEFDGAGGRFRHGERIGDVDQRTFHDVPSGSWRVLNNVDVRTYTKALDGGYVRAEKGADGHWTWQRFGGDGTEVLSGDRHWSWNHVAFRDTYRDAVTGLETVAQRRGATWPFGGLHGSRMYQEHAVLPGHAPAGGRVDPGEYTGQHPTNAPIERLEALSDGGSLLVKRFADMRPPAFFWKSAAGRDPFEGFFADLFTGASLNRVSHWTETAADGTPLTGVRLNPTGANWADFDQYGRLVRESRKLENGQVIEVGRSMEDPSRWAPAPEFRAGDSYELHWRNTTTGRTGTRYVDGSGRWRDVLVDDGGVERVVLRSQGKGTREYLFDPPSTGDLRLDDNAGLWVDKNAQQHISGRRDLVDGKIVEASGSPYRTRWAWKSYAPDAPDTVLAEGVRRQNRGSIYARPWDDSFQDFDAGGGLVRQRHATDTGSAWIDAVRQDDGTWTWTRRAADGTVHSSGVRVHDDLASGRWRDLLDGQEVRRVVGDRVREYRYEVVAPQPPVAAAPDPGRGTTLADLLARSSRHFEPPATVRVDPDVWKEYDAGKVFRERIAVEGVPGRHRLVDRQWGQWVEFQDGHLFQWRTIDGRVWRTDAFGRVGTSGRVDLTGGPRTLIGRETDFRGRDVEIMARLREVQDVWHGPFTAVRGGDVVEMPMWQRELRAGLTSFTTGFLTDFTAGLVITAATNNGNLTETDVYKALLSGAVGGTFNSGLTVLYNHTRLGWLKTRMGTMDWGGHPNQVTTTQTDDWATEFTAQDKATRWRNATYANTFGLATGAVSAFVSNAISAAVFGVNGNEVKGWDALVAGGWGAAGSLFGGVSTGLGRNIWHLSTGSRVFHKGGLGELGMNWAESALSKYLAFEIAARDKRDGGHLPTPGRAFPAPPLATPPPPAPPPPPPLPAPDQPAALTEGMELP